MFREAGRASTGAPAAAGAPAAQRIVHAPACTCPDCGAADAPDRRGRLRGARIRAGALQGDPARAPEARLPASASASCRCRRRRARSRAGWPARDCSPTCWSRSTPTTLPLYRQAQIYAREGVELERSTLAEWVAGCFRLLDPLVEALGALCDGGRQAARRRHPGAGARSGPRQDQDRAAVDLRARRSARRQH